MRVLESVKKTVTSILMVSVFGQSVWADEFTREGVFGSPVESKEGSSIETMSCPRSVSTFDPYLFQVEEICPADAAQSSNACFQKMREESSEGVGFAENTVLEKCYVEFEGLPQMRQESSSGLKRGSEAAGGRFLLTRLCHSVIAIGGVIGSYILIRYAGPFVRQRFVFEQPDLSGSLVLSSESRMSNLVSQAVS